LASSLCTLDSILFEERNHAVLSIRGCFGERSVGGSAIGEEGL
jgi:hypothetical protein